MSAPPDRESHREAGGELVELRIDALAAGGDGVGRAADGRVVFVPLTAPGDRVRARVTMRRKRFARAELEEVLEPGPDRVAPPCEVFGDCGGCAWQHVDYDAQCEAKRRIVEDALRRLGKLAPPVAVSLHPSPAAYAYRARARVLVHGGRVGFRRRRSHDLCAVERCPVLAPPLEDALRRLSEAARAGDATDGEWELGAGREGGVARRTDGEGEALELPLPEPLRISPGVFYQANAGLHASLVDAVTKSAGSGSRALELFAGAGFFTLRLARVFEQVVAVEARDAAIDDLRHNLASADLGNVEVVHDRVEAALAAQAAEAPFFDAVVLDPPRSGLASGAAERLCALAPRRLVYLSCDAATLARDLAALVAGGFALTGVEAFDLFPQTPHVEVLATLQHGAPRERPAG